MHLASPDSVLKTKTAEMSSSRCRLLEVSQRLKLTKTESHEPIKPGRKMTLTQPSEKHPNRLLTGGNSILAAGLRHFKGPGRKRRWDVLSIAGAGLWCAHRALPRVPGRGEGCGGLSPCPPLHGPKTQQMAVVAILVPLYLRMVLAGAKRSWLRLMRLQCPGGFPAGLAG